MDSVCSVLNGEPYSTCVSIYYTIYVVHALTGSQDSLGRPEKGDRKKKGDKDRNSFIMERTQSESAKDRVAVDKKGVKGHNHKRQRSWGGNKLLEVDTGG